MPHLRLSTWARHCLEWWKVYFAQTSEVWCSTEEERKTDISWTDAAGDGTLAAIVFDKGKFYHTTAKTPQWLYESLLPREKQQIQVLELVAVLLCIGTVPDLLENSSGCHTTTMTQREVA